MCDIFFEVPCPSLDRYLCTIYPAGLGVSSTTITNVGASKVDEEHGPEGIV